MKDRQFKTVLGLVVAAGLVMGLIAFRMTDGSGAVATAAVGAKAIGGDPNAPRPSAADGIASEPVDTTPQAPEALSQNGEPMPSAKDSPEMLGPGTGDAPGTAAEPPPQPGAPTSSADDVTPSSGDAPPQ